MTTMMKEEEREGLDSKSVEWIRQSAVTEMALFAVSFFCCISLRLSPVLRTLKFVNMHIQKLYHRNE